MPELDDLTLEQIDTLFTPADVAAEAQAWRVLCDTQGQDTLRRQDIIAEGAARWRMTPVPTEEQLDAGWA
mgnify:CR=1 FL=1